MSQRLSGVRVIRVAESVWYLFMGFFFCQPSATILKIREVRNRTGSYAKVAICSLKTREI